MGHYETSKQSLDSEMYDSHQQVYLDFRRHCGNQRINTDLALTIAIRSSHPDCHVTSINARSCDLIGFAKAGNGTINLHTEGDNLLTERTYDPPPTRLEGGEGELHDRVSFGFYDGSFNGQSFYFYRVEWRDEYYGSSMKKYFVLTPKASVDAAGHASEADKLVLTASKWTSELHEEIYVFDSGDWTKSKSLWAAVQHSSWDDVILDPTMKETLISDVQNFFDSRTLYEEYAVPWKRGIIFHGTPGCGKTISIKALINSLEKRDTPVASLYVKSLKTCEGEEYSLREIFSQARIMAPCMLVFEDLDSLVHEKVRSYFLNEVDGLEDNNGILMIGSTNHLEKLDPGISKRPSRFDRKYHYKLPGKRERVLYCEYWKKKLEKNSNVDFDSAICDVVADFTDGFSFAYLKELFVQTLLTIVGGRANEVEEEQVEEVAKKGKVVENSARVIVGEGKVDSSKTESNEESKSADDVPTKVKDPDGIERQMPSVKIPDSLKENSLMRVLHKQFLALWKDMDNTQDEEAGLKKPAGEDEKEDESDEQNEGESDSSGMASHEQVC